MSYYGSGLVTRIREVLEDGAGTLRTLGASDRFGGDLPPGLDVNEECRRALTNRRAEATVTTVGRSAASPPRIGNIALYDVGVQVRVVYAITTASKLDDDTRDGIRGVAYRDADRIEQALTFPGNLTTTTAGAATGIVSGMLAKDGQSRFEWSAAPNANEGGALIVTHPFKCVVQSAPAVT